MVNAVRRAGPEMRQSLRALLDELRRYAKRHEDEIVVRVMSRWISLRSRRAGKIFAELRPSKEKVEIFLLPPPGELGDRPEVFRPPPSQGWGWFRSKSLIDGEGDLRRAAKILRISYLSTIRGNGRGSGKR